ncbi:MAG: universal stress protein [Planctomycetota bacterium]|jgi:nucleotide-binding universal stress UspA family protein
MGSTFLVPLDGSDLGDKVLERLTPLLGQPGAKAELLMVIPEDESAEARRHLQRIQGNLEGIGVEVNRHIRAGDPASEILDLAKKLKPDLIAMSTRGRSGPARWVLGSVAERVIRRAKAPVLALNPAALERAPENPAKPFRKVLVPLDGSERGSLVLGIAGRLARANDASMVLLHVLPAKLDNPEARGEAGELLEIAKTRVEEDGCTASIAVVSGEPAECIITNAEDEGADLIAMTTHGHTGLERWMLGSVAEKVLRGSQVPLLIQRTVTANWTRVLGEPPK